MAFDESLWGTNAKERHATIEREGVSSTVNRKLRGKRGVVESNDTADKAGVMFWYREGGVDPRRDSQDLGAAVRRCVRKTGRKLLRRTWASARQSPRVRRRWGNLMNSASRGWGAELLRRSLGCRPGLTGANGVANRRKSFSEQFFPSSPAGITGLGVVRPETDAPHGVEKAGFSQTSFCASSQEVVFHGRVP